MPTDDQMTVDERYKYLRKVQKRYKKANREERSILLNEMVAVTSLHRKSLIRLMNEPIQRRKRQQQRGARYGPEVDLVLDVIAQSMDYPCAERLQPNLGWMADHLVQHGEIEVTDTIRK